MFVEMTSPANQFLPFFPAGMPDETIESRISRYHILRGQPTAKITYQQLFNAPPFSLTTLVQPHLDKLASKLPGSAKHNLQTIQNENTLLPLCQHFSGTQVSLTNPASNVDIHAIELPRRIKGSSSVTHMCPQCLVQDEQEYGCAYIHRSHQIPGVTICWKHQCKLLDRCPACSCPFARRNELILSAWLGCTCGYVIGDHPKLIEEPVKEVEVGFANFTKTLLTTEPILLSTEQLANLYKRRAIELGFGRGVDKLNRGSLFAQLEDYFGIELLSKIDAAYSSGKTSGWFHVVGTSAAAESPLYRHLLLAYFLFRDASLFLDKARSSVITPPLSETLKTPQSLEQVEDDLIHDLVKTAMRYGCNAQALWKYNFGAMKRLVKILPTACEVIDTRLKDEGEKRERDSKEAMLRKKKDEVQDVQWAAAIRSTCKNLYEENKRPIRVSKSRLIKQPKLNGQTRNCTTWPNKDRFPLTIAASLECMESTWHFYARRLLWTVLSLPDPETSDHVIIKLSGLEVHKAREVLKYFADIPRSSGTSMSIINTILNIRGIKNDWAGPCPERTFYKAGRAYQLRTSRRGSIGRPASAPATSSQI
ncbi:MULTISPECIES: TnsD family Tn7-like transposition protein [unclassified Undibacterium]|uniref:TnsD family Tn7-like transposition protein n=1 Tax=unclassified Undibacterium TaxID=2630295 RepID=UPI00164BD607|nr:MULTISPECIES: TnsD family Tn7-like transposition protein [unclassified Undibacterium]MBC3878318.1 TniQ family protein [Undibacterium sp. FT79W]MBC3927330.1 TniQ family protein [Undibacterium sp. CY21W]